MIHISRASWEDSQLTFQGARVRFLWPHYLRAKHGLASSKIKELDKCTRCE